MHGQQTLNPGLVLAWGGDRSEDDDALAVAARFAHLNFAIHNDTLSIMRAIATSGELEALSAERVWQETSEALSGDQPSIYFSVLKSCDALSYWFKELDALWGIPNPSEWHRVCQPQSHCRERVLLKASNVAHCPPPLSLPNVVTIT